MVQTFKITDEALLKIADERDALRADLAAARAEIERLNKVIAIITPEKEVAGVIMNLRADLAAAVDTIRRIATSYDVDAMAEARAFLKRMEVTP